MSPSHFIIWLIPLLLLVLSCAALSASSPGIWQTLLSSGEYEKIFQIGEFDDPANQFALASSDATKFAQRSPEGVTYIVSKSQPSDWSFIIPTKPMPFERSNPFTYLPLNLNSPKNPKTIMSCLSTSSTYTNDSHPCLKFPSTAT